MNAQTLTGTTIETTDGASCVGKAARTIHNGRDVWHVWVDFGTAGDWDDYLPGTMTEAEVLEHINEMATEWAAER